MYQIPGLAYPAHPFRFPIRDPFFKMLPRTLSNFMNAFTASDHTFYPFATTNAQDYKNLMSVYLDATLHPLLKETDFTQEGWRIGPENPQATEAGDDASAEKSKLVFKGVVYNEMKGQMSDASYLFYTRFQDHIFPSINNSGGDPQKITDLTYQQLKDFHASHYHPSNARVFTYGDMPLEDHLQEVNARLEKFEPLKRSMDIMVPIELSSPQSITVKGPVDPLVDANMQHKTSLSWVFGDTSDVVETFSLGLISALLTDGYGSPLYKSLIEAGLGTDWSPNSGYDNSGKVGIFSIGLTGVKEADLDTVEQQIHQTLKDVRAKGFEKAKVDGYLHQLELGLKHKTANFGMALLQRLKPKWFVGVDPFDELAWNDTVTKFQKLYAQGGYLEGLLDRYLLHGNTLKFTMEPSPSYEKEIEAEEATRLSDKIAKITEKAGGEANARAELEHQELVLLKEQAKSSTQDLSCLPTVRVKDIPREKPIIETRNSNVQSVDVQWREAPTNGLTYFRAIHTFENFPESLRPLVPLFTDAIMRLGTKDMAMETIEDLIKLKTGGVSVGHHAVPAPANILLCKEGISFSGTALDRNVPDMFNLLRKIVFETDFDSAAAQAQVRQLLQASANGAVNNIASSGHGFAMGYAGAGLTNYARIKEQIGGLSQIKLITSLASRSEEQGFADIIAQLKTIQSLALASTPSLRVAITCGSDSVSANNAHLQSFLSSIPHTLPELAKNPAPTFSRVSKTFFPLPYQVYYSAFALRSVPYTSPDSAPLQILAQLLTHKHLLHEIREKGGAYGAGASMGAMSGLFSFFSYRDPNPENTLKILRQVGEVAMNREWSPTDIEEAKISVFQSLDAPKSVSEEGMDRFVFELGQGVVQERRQRLLDVNSHQIRDVAERYLFDPITRQEGKWVVLGERKSWVDEQWKLGDMGAVSGGVTNSSDQTVPEVESDMQDEDDVQQSALGS